MCALPSLGKVPDRQQCRERERRERREILVTIAKRDESPSPSLSPCPSLLLLLPLFVPNNFVVYAIYSFLSAVETKKASVALKEGGD